MEPFGIQATCLAASVAVALALRAVRRKSLTTAGAMAAFGVGFLSVITGLRGFNLLVFYQIATMATKYQKQLKMKHDGTYAQSATRGLTQVLACSILAVLLSLVHVVYCGKERPIDFHRHRLPSQLTCAILAHHATCLADTLASELGMLSQQQPRLITQPWRRVPPGTNGGITLWGTMWSGIGGGIIGLSTILMDTISGIPPEQPYSLILLGVGCGLLGSWIDSLLGATIQETYFDDEKKLVYHHDATMTPQSARLISGRNFLNNEQVNFFSIAITMVLGGWVLGPLIFGNGA